MHAFPAHGRGRAWGFRGASVAPNIRITGDRYGAHGAYGAYGPYGPYGACRTSRSCS
jgi:hypothetical protein